MDNYSEYFRIASLYTRIHSQKHKIDNSQYTNNLHNDFFNPQKINSQNIQKEDSLKNNINNKISTQIRTKEMEHDINTQNLCDTSGTSGTESVYFPNTSNNYFNLRNSQKENNNTQFQNLPGYNDEEFFKLEDYNNIFRHSKTVYIKNPNFQNISDSTLNNNNNYSILGLQHKNSAGNKFQKFDFSDFNNRKNSTDSYNNPLMTNSFYRFSNPLNIMSKNNIENDLDLSRKPSLDNLPFMRSNTSQSYELNNLQNSNPNISSKNFNKSKKDDIKKWLSRM